MAALTRCRVDLARALLDRSDSLPPRWQKGGLCDPFAGPPCVSEYDIKQPTRLP